MPVRSAFTLVVCQYTLVIVVCCWFYRVEPTVRLFKMGGKHYDFENLMHCIRCGLLLQTE